MLTYSYLLIFCAYTCLKVVTKADYRVRRNWLRQSLVGRLFSLRLFFGFLVFFLLFSCTPHHFLHSALSQVLTPSALGQGVPPCALSLQPWLLLLKDTQFVLFFSSKVIWQFILQTTQHVGSSCVSCFACYQSTFGKKSSKLFPEHQPGPRRVVISEVNPTLLLKALRALAFCCFVFRLFWFSFLRRGSFHVVQAGSVM
jgi:hypothetical protein